METNPPVNDPQDQEAPVSQTASPQKPLQVENVQYGVKVGSFFSRAGLGYVVSNVSLAILVLLTASVLHGFAGELFGFNKNALGERIITLIALAVPLIPLHLFSSSRLRALLQDPVYLEDIVFKKHLRRSIWAEIIVGVWVISTSLYSGLSILFLDRAGNALDPLSTALLFGSAFAGLILWSYDFEKRTKR